ncbi:MAG: hypothetical protein IT166_06140 [Bryobacterales bacterium]|nr:hypothetical protein [Bryobacterales bacterium]
MKPMNTITKELFAQAYESGHNKTVSFLLSRGYNPQLAEEAAQAAWVRGWERKEQLRDFRKAIPWVNSIALNIGRTRTRQGARLQSLPETLKDHWREPIASIDVGGKLQECSDAERNLLEERYIWGWGADELAREHHCSSLAIRLRLHRARERMRSLLAG